MDAQLATALAGIMPLLESLVALGLPGLILGMAAIPAVVIALICWIGYRHDNQIKKATESYRRDTQEILAAYRKDMQLTLEAYRKDVMEIQQSMADRHEECIREFTEKHQQVVTFYSNNVTLVKSHEKLAEANQALIVNNTRAMEHLCVVVESLAKNQGK